MTLTRIDPFRTMLSFRRKVQGERAEATYRNGVLRLAIPKAEGVKPRQISVKVEEPSTS